MTDYLRGRLYHLYNNDSLSRVLFGMVLSLLSFKHRRWSLTSPADLHGCMWLSPCVVTFFTCQALAYNNFEFGGKQYYYNLSLRKPLLKLQVSPLPAFNCFFPRYDQFHSPQSSMTTNNPCEIHTSESQDKRYLLAQREELYLVRWSSANADRERSALPGL